MIAIKYVIAKAGETSGSRTALFVVWTQVVIGGFGLDPSLS